MRFMLLAVLFLAVSQTTAVEAGATNTQRSTHERRLVLQKNPQLLPRPVEPPTTTPTTPVPECEDQEYRCPNPPHRCIHYERLCDGHNDCGDGTDERGCESGDSHERGTDRDSGKDGVVDKDDLDPTLLPGTADHSAEEEREIVLVAYLRITCSPIPIILLS